MFLVKKVKKQIKWEQKESRQQVTTAISLPKTKTQNIFKQIEAIAPKL
jgi:hypothetical protein